MSVKQALRQMHAGTYVLFFISRTWLVSCILVFRYERPVPYRCVHLTPTRVCQGYALPGTLGTFASATPAQK